MYCLKRVLLIQALSLFATVTNGRATLSTLHAPHRSNGLGSNPMKALEAVSACIRQICLTTVMMEMKFGRCVSVKSFSQPFDIVGEIEHPELRRKCRYQNARLVDDFQLRLSGIC